MKQCPTCGQWKSHEDFYKDASRKDGVTRQCKVCSDAYTRRYRAANKEKINARNRRNWRENGHYRSAHLRFRYGIDQAGYEALLIEQNGACAICKCKPPSDQRLHVDHVEGTRFIRGLLCGNCNRMIGLAYHNPFTLQAAVGYLETRHQGEVIYAATA